MIQNPCDKGICRGSGSKTRLQASRQSLAPRYSPGPRLHGKLASVSLAALAGPCCLSPPVPGPSAWSPTPTHTSRHRPPPAASGHQGQGEVGLPSPSGSTARKCALLSAMASWKCSAVFSMIQCCISLALILLSVFKSTLQAHETCQARPPGPRQTGGRTEGWPERFCRQPQNHHEQQHIPPNGDAGEVGGMWGTQWGNQGGCWAVSLPHQSRDHWEGNKPPPPAAGRGESSTQFHRPTHLGLTMSPW